jgi:MoaA/NifB/PqqE/SkfB family radical SAM enzyme
MIQISNIPNISIQLVKDLAAVFSYELDYYRERPYTATIFLTYRCDSNCKTCTLWERPKEIEKKRELGIDTWKQLINKLHKSGIREVEIFGGNVLLRKDLLIPLLRHLRDKSFIVHMPTNQMGLDEEISKVIIECVDHLYISTDGVGELQDDIRGRSGAFKNVSSTISMLLKLRGKSKKTRFICNTTVSKFNVDKLEDILEYAASACFDEIHFEYVGETTEEDLDNSLIDGLRPAAYYIRKDESVLIDRESAVSLKRRLPKMARKYADNNIRVDYKNIDPLSIDNLVDGTIPQKKCYVIRNEVTLDPYGNMIACPFINNYIYGDLKKDDLEKLWQGKPAKRFRKVQDCQDTHMCRHCILGAQRNRSVTASLKRLFKRKIKKIME